MHAHDATDGAATAQNVFQKFWSVLGLPGRIALIGVAIVLVTWLLVLVLRRLGRAGRRSLSYGFTGIMLVGAVGLGTWSARLPEPGGSYFVLWHQVVRVGAALCAWWFVVAAILLALPWVFNWLESRGFTSFIAVRHVRSQKSGFLTVISILSTGGVALSSLALCMVVSIMGGFGADLKRKILGNNAHIRIDTDRVGGVDDWEPILRDVRLVHGVVGATPVAGGEAMGMLDGTSPPGASPPYLAGTIAQN